jgi:hypothetical protein
MAPNSIPAGRMSWMKICWPKTFAGMSTRGYDVPIPHEHPSFATSNNVGVRSPQQVEQARVRGRLGERPIGRECGSYCCGPPQRPIA